MLTVPTHSYSVCTRERTIWVKRPMSDVLIFRQKNSMFDFDVYLFTRIRKQRWHVNSLGTVLRETVATDSPSAIPTVAHLRRWANISHITSQTMLGISRLGYSWWRLFAYYVCVVLQYGICCRYYVFADQRWRPEWVWVQCTNACLTCALLAGTDCIYSSS